jgi:formiminotetrahydrofolate cyclodeaminase
MESSLRALSIDAFLDALASGNATPGGGAAVALAGSAAAAQVAMVCNLTVGRPKFAAVDADARDILQEAEAVRARLQQGIDEDAAAYDAVMAATRLPRGDEEQTRARTAAIQQALKDASAPPLAAAQDCALVLALCRRAVEIVNPNAISDAAVAAELARAALEGAIENVEINLASIKDQEFVAESRQALRAATDGRARLADEVRERARARMG